MFMFHPRHPGEIVRKDGWKALDLTVTVAAKGLGVRRKTQSSILNRRSGVAAEMALRLFKALAGHAGALHVDATCLPSVASPAPRQEAAMEAAARGDQSSLRK
jgi:addiction module HigA family antidote